MHAAAAKGRKGHKAPSAADTLISAAQAAPHVPAAATMRAAAWSLVTPALFEALTQHQQSQLFSVSPSTPLRTGCNNGQPPAITQRHLQDNAGKLRCRGLYCDAALQALLRASAADPADLVRSAAHRALEALPLGADAVRPLLERFLAATPVVEEYARKRLRKETIDKTLASPAADHARASGKPHLSCLLSIRTLMSGAHTSAVSSSLLQQSGAI